MLPWTEGLWLLEPTPTPYGLCILKVMVGAVFSNQNISREKKNPTHRYGEMCWFQNIADR